MKEYNIGEYVVHKHTVCRITTIEKNYKYDDNYYIMTPIDDATVQIAVPVKDDAGSLRPVMSHKDAEALVKRIPQIEVIANQDRTLENEYRVLMNSDNVEDLVKVIKTTYARNDARSKTGRHAGEKDSAYFKRAEHSLYSELAVSLDMSYDQASAYVAKIVEEAARKAIKEKAAGSKKQKADKVEE
jgi:CarD family transcriptional regulator